MCTVFRKYDFIPSMVFLQKVCLFRGEKKKEKEWMESEMVLKVVWLYT